MPSTILALFLAGLLTILLPCILPLIPIVLGVSVSNQNKWRPLILIVCMLVGFVGSVFLLDVLLSQFVELADDVRIATYDVLFLFGVGFFFHKKTPQLVGAVLSGLFFIEKGMIAVIIAMILGVIAMEIGGRIAASIQQLGSDIQNKARGEFGQQSLLTTVIIGLTMGLVWVPCAGPALGFALAVVRNQPGLAAAGYLSAYAIGAGIPLLLIGYGGQYAVTSVRRLSQYTERIKEVAGVLLMLSAIALQLNILQNIQTYLAINTGFGNFGNSIEENLFHIGGSQSQQVGTGSMLPVYGMEPADFAGAGEWFNSPALHLNDLKGKVVLIDFWTYSCINCIRTLPYEEATWEKFKDQPFVLIGVHTPEFTFEKSASNVAMAIKEHNLTYPVVQDNDYGTWNAFNNEYWPAKYLIDANGNIRYEHFGEGAYEETDQAIASLLAESGHKTTSTATLPPEQQGSNNPITPETYLHSRGWNSFGNSQGGPDARVHAYTLPSSLTENDFYLDGTWQLVDDERQVLMSDNGSVTIDALAGEVNLVLGLEDGIKPVQADVLVDGKKTKTITIDRHDLFNLYKGPYGRHVVRLQIHGKGVAAYAYTFGS
ncbi:MAG TPA: cytochrome c biogenesis protein CcdA [Candidatus Peribacteraceae bacterium]|nr:cytochrome c biogenesis protein CcdA [Candidatus Peribacteraceae bacterium]